MTEAEHKKRAIRRIIWRTATFLLAACIIIAIGIWNHITPFRRYLPAIDVAAREEGQVRIHFLDVGQGDCEIVELPDGSALIIDSGDGSWTHNNHILQYLKNLHISTIFLIITHADSDHCGGAAALLEDISAETVYLPMIPASMGIYEAISQNAAAQDAQVKTLTRYDVIDRGGAYAVCISPYSVNESERNDSSTVLYFSYAGVNVLFGGDISEERENRLISEQILSEEIGENLFDSGDYAVRLRETDILKVSHHGSETSSSSAWLDLLSPGTAVISCGRDNDYGHPTGGALARLVAVGAEVFRTDELGDVMVTISKNGTYTTEYGYE